ncbi:hypothetical protein TNCV_2215481 [Trichonephila clavipes]|nr:hypothetical protein TNCV_2215481 [Trichonephila clavipes]
MLCLPYRILQPYHRSRVRKWACLQYDKYPQEQSDGFWSSLDCLQETGYSGGTMSPFQTSLSSACSTVMGLSVSGSTVDNRRGLLMFDTPSDTHWPCPDLEDVECYPGQHVLQIFHTVKTSVHGLPKDKQSPLFD